MQQLQTTEDVFDHIFDMIKMTETDDELAFHATSTIYRLLAINESELALAVLDTYKPKEN